MARLRISAHDLAIVRHAYAKQILAPYGIADQRLEAAFAAVRREDFLGPGPWKILRNFREYVETPDNDPVYLYTDDLVAILPERRLNNGQPSLHAHLLARAAPAQGEHAVHVGAGVGYYSAVLAELVSPSGKVTAIEFDEDLARRAAANCAAHPNVDVRQGDGSAASFQPADVIYVNAGATHPADTWLDWLKDGGRLVLPLTTDKGFGSGDANRFHLRGAVFLVTRKKNAFDAQWISPVAIFPCEGLRDPQSEQALAAAFQGGDYRQVKGLHRSGDLPSEQCWLQAPGWSLTYT
ncbi:MAG: methyltransferase domain-containing protein [Pseudomonadota bacterium]